MMNVETYYSILEWQGEDPRKIDRSTGKEIGQKIYEQDVRLGKTIWVNNKWKDFKFFLCLRDPLLCLLCNFSKVEWNEVFVVLLFIFNVSSILATLTASIGFHEMGHDHPPFAGSNQAVSHHNRSPSSLSNADETQFAHGMPVDERLCMLAGAAINGLIICFLALKWRHIESGQQPTKLTTFIMNQNGITIVFFTLCVLSMAYYFLNNELEFFSWFLTIYACQFVIAWLLELCVLSCLFRRAWQYDQRMMHLIPKFNPDGSFSHCSLPKSVYYVTFKDYEEWLEYTHTVQPAAEYNTQTDDDELDDQLNKPLLHTTTANTMMMTA